MIHDKNYSVINEFDVKCFTYTRIMYNYNPASDRN